MKPATRRAARHPGRMWMVLLLLLALAAGLRFFALGREGVWCDEAYTAQIVALPWSEMLDHQVQQDDAPPLYYVIQKVLAPLDHREGILRLPSALFGLAAVALLLWRYLRTADRAALWAAAVLAIHAFAVFYARQARSYSLVIFLALALLLATRDLLAGHRRAGPLLALSATLLWMTHHVGILLLATSICTYPLRRRGGVGLGRWLLWHGLPLVLWAGYWMVSADQFGTHVQGNAWIASQWQRHSLLYAPLLTLQAFLPGALYGPDGNLPLPVLVTRQPLWAYLATATGLLLLASLLLPRRLRERLRLARPQEAPDTRSAPTPEAVDVAETARPPDLGESRLIVLEFSLLLGPLILLAVGSILTEPAYVVGRTDAIAFAAFTMLAGRALARLPRRLASLLWLIWLGLSLAVLAPSHGLGGARPAKGRDREIAGLLAAHPSLQRDVVVHGILTAPSIEYYLDRQAPGHPRLWFPGIAGENPAAVPPTPSDSLAAYQAEAKALRRSWMASLGPEAGVWILAVLQPPRPDAPIFGAGGTITANSIAFPTSLLVHALIGLQPVTPVRVYRQDWMGGLRALLHIPRSQWIPLDDLPPVQPAGEPRDAGENGSR